MSFYVLRIKKFNSSDTQISDKIFSHLMDLAETFNNTVAFYEKEYKRISKLDGVKIQAQLFFYLDNGLLSDFHTMNFIPQQPRCINDPSTV